MSILKRIVRWTLTAAAGVAIFAVFALLTRGDLTPRPLPYSAETLDAVPRARAAGFDPDKPVVITQPVRQEAYDRAAQWKASRFSAADRARETALATVNTAVAAGEVPGWFPRGESPILADLVDRGLLPPVAERVGDEPVVMKGVDGVGRYGGTWMRVSNSLEDVSIVLIRMGVPSFMRFSPLGDPLVPHLAKSVESLDGGRSYLLRFRKGVKWSDGHPLTADAYLFWWKHIAHEPALVGSQPQIPDYLRARGQPPVVTRLDDYTVRFDYPTPFPLFPYAIARFAAPVSPHHYLRPYHPVLGDPAFIRERMAHWGLPSPRALWGFVTNWKNPELPSLSPWILRRPARVPPVVMVRNPYYFAVDEAGNQLPYIDQVQTAVVDQKMIPIALASGQATMQERHLRFANYTEVMSRRDLADQRVLHWYSANRSEFIINPNLNRFVPENDPVVAWKAALLADKHFRQALSLAINRAAVTKTIYSGAVQPAGLSPGNLSAYRHAASLAAFTAYEPAEANRLLDACWRAAGADPELRDTEGCRLAPDGKRLAFFLDYCDTTGDGPTPFVIDDWKAVGIRCIPRLRSRPLFYTEKASLNFDFNIWWGESEHDPRLYARNFVASDTESFYAGGWGRWRQQGGLYRSGEVRFSANAIPIPQDHDMFRALLEFEEAFYAPTRAAAKKHIAKMLDLYADNLWVISLADAPAQTVVVDNDLRNVPDNALYGYMYSTPNNAGTETFYFEHPKLSPGARREIVAMLRAPEPNPGLGGPAGDGAPWTSRLVSWLCWGIPALLVVLLCLRHPFVLRRLFLMVPTVLVVSMLVFAIIQLPPGDFLTARIIELEQTGADPAMVEEQVKELKELFHYDDPVWKRYLRWVGLYWFTDFSPANEGLLQGNLGRSMETQRPVNQMVGDTIWLTVGVSLGTILLTWIVALPIGIYSAVRQYTLSDYVITLIGFVGMCIPPFLLALVLMVLTNATGLFSPEFAAQPEWDWPKFVDLIKHIWIPMVVLGAEGMTGMIRVMRANLLDELRKPYVTTARAKGMRPLALLLKYPVRLALNPFISGIGGLFPALVSGGAIVAMVLSLPMVGPLMLTALFTQDMNFAGSMLVVLSLLGVFGTLVSDLLLLWVDPRIRLEGSGK